MIHKLTQVVIANPHVLILYADSLGCVKHWIAVHGAGCGRWRGWFTTNWRGACSHWPLGYNLFRGSTTWNLWFLVGPALERMSGVCTAVATMLPLNIC